MKLILLKPLHLAGVLHEKGEEVELDEASYKYVMETYMTERKIQVQKEAEAKVVLDLLKAPTEEKKEAKK